MQDIQAEIRKLVKAIYECRDRSRDGWVTWNQVARQLTGTNQILDYLVGISALSECRGLFARTDHAVKLTEEGLNFHRAIGNVEKPIPGKIADAVISYARGLRPIVLDIQSVSIVATVGKKIVHAIFVELSDDVLPNETPVRVACRTGRQVHGKLVGQEPDGEVLYVACDADILPSQEPHKLFIDRAYLLTQLADQLQSLPSLPDRMSDAFKPSTLPAIANVDSKLVAEKLAEVKPPWTYFLWGPPGAGKTFGLGHFVAKLVSQFPNESVLIVAPSNRAVDVALSHLQTRFTENALNRWILARRVLRFGYPRSPEILAIPELLGPSNLDELSRRQNQISRKIKQHEQDQGSLSDLAVLRAELLAAQEAVKEAVREHVAQCSVVATTTTLAYMPNSPVATRIWDTVIVDEVTMVSPAICTFLASRAKKRFLLAGDPCQLGPVYESRSGADDSLSLWLKNDVFTIAGISSGQLNAKAIKIDDSRLIRISSQRRCGTQIWNQISHLYPQIGNASNCDQVQRIAALPPRPKSSIVLVDLSNGVAECEQMKKSWHNTESARKAIEVACDIASKALSPCRIAIICPYRAQAKTLRQKIREKQSENPSIFKLTSVEAGTVHQFQGSEADAVIFDLVDGPGRNNLGHLLKGDAGIRLVNVAISRAKGKLVIIADQEWCRNSDVSAHNHLLSQLVLKPESVISAGPQQKRRMIAPYESGAGYTCITCRTMIPNNPYLAGRTFNCPSCGKKQSMPFL